jgi:hypothetical protein
VVQRRDIWGEQEAQRTFALASYSNRSAVNAARACLFLRGSFAAYAFNDANMGWMRGEGIHVCVGCVKESVRLHTLTDTVYTVALLLVAAIHVQQTLRVSSGSQVGKSLQH